MRKIAFVAALGLLITAGLSINYFRVDAAGGDVDNTFVTGTGFSGSLLPGIVATSVRCSAVQPDGKIVVGGNFLQYNGTAAFSIVRLNSDGTIDPTFITGAGANGFVLGMVLQPDGKIIIAGSFPTYDGHSSPGVARINSDGSFDATFNVGTGVSLFGASPVALQADGKVLVGGAFLDFNSSGYGRLVRLNPNGSVDTTFNVGGSGINPGDVPEAILVRPDNKIILAGGFDEYNGVTVGGLARLNSNGSLDGTFNPGGAGVGAGGINSAALQPDGKIVIGGNFIKYNTTSVKDFARVNADGSIDSSFDVGLGVSDIVYAVKVQPDGKIVIGGDFIGATGPSGSIFRSRVMRFNPNGSHDTNFGINSAGANQTVRTIALQSDGKIFIGGDFTDYQGTSINCLARLKTAPGSVSVTQSFFTSSEGAGTSAVTVSRFGGSDGDVVLKVAITDFSTTPADYRLAPGGLDNTFNYGSNRGANNLVTAMVQQPDGKILIAGSMNSYNGDTQASDAIMRLNADGTLDTSFNYGAGKGADNIVNAVALQADGKILIGGDFTAYNGDANASNRILRLNSDGSLDTSFNYGAANGGNSSVNAIVVQPDGRIVVGGALTSYNGDGNASDGVLRLNPDGSLDKVFFNYGSAKGTDNPVLAVALQPDGKILVGGQFVSYNGETKASDRIMRLDAVGAIDTSFNFGNTLGANAGVHALALQTDGKIIIGGDFLTFNGDASTSGRVARLNANGSLDTAFNYSQSGANDFVLAVAIQPDDKIIIGGAATSYNGDGLAGDRVMRLNANGSLDTSFNYNNSGVDGFVLALAIQGDGRILAGGIFGGYNGDANASDRILRLENNLFVTWPAGDLTTKTIRLPIVDDNIEENNEDLFMDLSIVKGNSGFTTLPGAFFATRAALTITDNDLTVSQVSGTGPAGGAATLTAKLTRLSTNLSGKTVNFTVNGSAFGSAVTDSNGVATFTGGSLTGIGAGTYANAVAANFPGDSTFVADSGTGTLTVTQGTQTITFDPLGDRAFNSGDFTVTATASSGLTVGFGAAGNCTIGGSTVHMTAVGLCTITASQIGDANFGAAPDVDRSFNIIKANQTITFAPLPDKSFGDSDFTVTANASSALAVSFSTSGQCSVTTPSPGTVHLSAAGACTITASQGGDTNFNGAPDVSRNFTIGKGNQTITFNSLANKSFGDADFPVSASASSGLSVSFGATGNCTITNGTIHLTGAGACTVTASQGGDSNFNAAADVAQSFNIAKASQTITFNGLANKTFGDADFPVNASASSGLGVSFGISGNCTITSNSVHLTGAGACTITASQGGNADYDAAADVSQGISIAKANSTTALVPSINPSEVGQSVTFTATVNSAGGIPTGTIQFKADGIDLGAPALLNGSGVANTSTSSLTAGTHTVTAEYGGAANFNPGSGNVDQLVKPGISINDVSIAEGDSGVKVMSFSVTLSAVSNVNISASFATANGTADAPSDYVSSTGQVTFNPGDLSKSIDVTINGDQTAEPDETLTVSLSNPVNANITRSQGTGTLLNDDAVGSIISFSQAAYTVTESGGAATITVNRTGNTSQFVSVDYTTPDDSSALVFLPCATPSGVATPRCDFTTALGTLNFAAGETARTFMVLITQDNFVEGPETIGLTLSNPTGSAVFGSIPTATLTITDDPIEPAGNPIDEPANFVRQQYHDFLNREPDTAGLNYWTSGITVCGANQACIEAARNNISAAFFLSIEFQNTGLYVERIYKTSFGDINQPAIPVPVRFTGFMRDSQQVGAGIVVGQANWQTQLDANKNAFALAFVQRAEFSARYPSLFNATAFVNSLNTNAGGVLSDSERSALISQLSASPSDPTMRANVLRQIADNQLFQQREFNSAFVLMEYFGFLRRNPDAAPEATLNFEGYNFWLNKLNQVNGDFRKAEMLKAFTGAAEYRRRFGLQ